MSPEVVGVFINALRNFEPRWALALLVGGVLSWRSPQIIKELFTGVRSLMLVWKKTRPTN